MSNQITSFVGGNPPPFPGGLKRGARGDAPKLLQEFLSLVGYDLELDGIFGGATEQALLLFSRERVGEEYASKELTRRIWSDLIEPYRKALRKLATRAQFEKLVVAYAKKHLAAGAMELKGSNLGPWVRLYMKGYEGAPFAWCAGFVCFLIRQAALTYGMSDEDMKKYLPDTFSCDKLAGWGASRSKLLTVVGEGTKILPGAIFLVYRGNSDWVHTGIVISKNRDSVETIEGNTNVAGSREGICVMRRFRGLKNLHFITSYSPPKSLLNIPS